MSLNSNNMNVTSRKAALKTSAAFALSCLLVLGLVPFGSLGFAETPSSDTAAPKAGEGTPVVAVVGGKPADQAGSKDEPTSDEPSRTEEAAPIVSDASETPDKSEAEAPAPVEPSAKPNEDSGAVEVPKVDELAWYIGRDDAGAVKAELWPDGTFVLDGSGATVAFDETEKPDGAKAVTTPWIADGYADQITRVVFADAVQPESLAHWFDGCVNLRSVSHIPASVKDLTCAFRGCAKLDEALRLPRGVQLLGSAFKGCASLAAAPAIPASVKDASSAFEGCTALAALPSFEGAPAAMDRMFFDCPNVVDVPDAFAFGASSKACFGFEKQPAEPLATAYAGSDEAVLAYDWAADGRELVVPEPSAAEEPPAGEEGSANPGDESDVVEGEPADAPGSEAEDALAGEATEEGAEGAALEAKVEPELGLATPAAEEAAASKQVSITVPSSVPLLLNANGQGASAIPVSVANRSDAAVRIVGVRLKRSSVDIPGGSWSLVSQDTGTRFVEGARFTPSGKEAVLTTPVELAANSPERQFTWEGAFTDFEMKSLIKMATDADGSFTYGTMIWHIEAV